MRHLWKNFKKSYYGPLFNYNMWSADKSYTIEKFNWHMARIQEKCPEAIAFLDEIMRIIPTYGVEANFLIVARLIISITISLKVSTIG
jgi:hypothetical protein